MYIVDMHLLRYGIYGGTSHNVSYMTVQIMEHRMDALPPYSREGNDLWHTLCKHHSSSKLVSNNTKALEQHCTGN